LRTLSVGRILDSGQHYGGHAYNDGMLEAQHRGVAVTIARCGDPLNVEEIAIEVLSPCGALLVGGKNDVNEKSIVTRVTIASTRILFMGDAGWQTEIGLLHRGIDLHADILKVGHHGSTFASSPAFIAAVAPRFALISVRRHNLFGRPSTRALAALESVGADLYCTYRCGATTAIATPALHVLTTFTCNHKSIGLPARPRFFSTRQAD